MGLFLSCSLVSKFCTGHISETAVFFPLYSSWVAMVSFLDLRIDYFSGVQSMSHYVHEMLSMLHKVGNHTNSYWDGEINVATDLMKLPLDSCDRQNIYWWLGERLCTQLKCMTGIPSANTGDTTVCTKLIQWNSHQIALTNRVETTHISVA